MEAALVKEKIYAGFLGMCAGIRLGAPVEPAFWTYDRIKSTYGTIEGYVKEYKNFAADDDSNGPVYFLRALCDDARERNPVPDDIGRAWLNYARNGVGLYWWGGYGVSTEHTAYVNLLHGMKAPQSGSAEVNGKILSEQIGGQIFIDTWGLICPGNPEKAAELGEIAASVSHDGEGVYGARFFCAAIAQAFVSNDIYEIVNTALRYIPEESLYYQVSKAVIEFHRENPDDFGACFKMLEKNWGYDKYTGICHIIPNAGVCILSMLYGGGRLDRTIEIAAMCGWDTDCNAGNVGTVLGVMCGPDGVPERYRKPINDSIVLSGISGCLNILDIPSYVKELCSFAERFTSVRFGEAYTAGNDVFFDFELPGSTHGMRLSNDYRFRMKHSAEKAHSGGGSLEVLFDRLVRGEHTKVFYKPFYSRDAFSDERYMPVFSPQVASGQRLSAWVYLDQWTGSDPPWIAPYIRTAHEKQELAAGLVKLVNGEWIELVYDVPNTNGAVIDEIGFIIEGSNPEKFKSAGRIFMDDFKIDGKAGYSIDFKKQKKEFGSVTPFSHNGGSWELEPGGMAMMTADKAEAYTGRYYAKDLSVSAGVVPCYGSSHLLAVRCQGAMRGYWAGLSGENRVSIFKEDFGLVELAAAEFKWELNEKVELRLSAVGNEITLCIDGKELLKANDASFGYGMAGCGAKKMSRSLFTGFNIKEI